MGQNGKLNLAECVLMLIGGMIGSAIFSLSGLTLLMSGPAAVLSWLLGGVLMFLYGLCMAELACRYPKSGGVYVFPRLAFGGVTGSVLGWLACWGAILTNVVAVAFAAIYVGQYLSFTFAWARDFQVTFALLSLVLCLMLNTLRFELTGKINGIVVMVLLLTIFAYVYCAFFGGRYDAGLLRPFFGQGTLGVGGFIASVPIAIIGYSCIAALAFMASDVQDTNRTVPLSMLISIVVVALIYALVIVSTAGLVSVQYLKDNPGMCYIPLFVACFEKLLHFPWLMPVVSISSVLALLTTMLVCTSMNARLLKVAGEEGLMPAFMAKNNKNGVPEAAATVTIGCSMLLSCFPQCTKEIVNFGAVFNIITMVLTILALIKSRGSKAVPGVFVAPFGLVLPIVTLLLLFGCYLLQLLSCSPFQWIYTLGFLAVGCLIPYYCRKR